MIEICCSMVNHSIMNVDDNNRIQNEFLRKNNIIFFQRCCLAKKKKRLRIKSEDVFVFEINANHFLVHIWGEKGAKSRNQETRKRKIYAHHWMKVRSPRSFESIRFFFS